MLKKRRRRSKYKKGLNIRRLIKLLFFLSISVLLFHSLFISKIFLIKEIQLNQETINNTALSNKISDLLEINIDKNIILLNTQKIADDLILSFPELEEIKVYKNYPSTLKIEFKEFDVAANLINESSELKKTYVINQVGYIVKEDAENPNLPYIRLKSDQAINADTTVIASEKLKYILNTKKYFEDKFGMKIKEVIYKPIPREIHLLTERDFLIWLDIQEDYKSQLDKLKKAALKLNIYEENLYYIDLRIAGTNGDKIIYKRK